MVIAVVLVNMQVASVANSHLEKARSLASTVPAPAIPVLLPAVIHVTCILHYMFFVP
jgi:hypothetical protein